MNALDREMIESYARYFCWLRDNGGSAKSMETLQRYWIHRGEQQLFDALVVEAGSQHVDRRGEIS